MGVAVLAALAAGARAQTAAQGQPAQPPAGETSVRFVVFDAQGQPVETLGPEDIRVEVAGRALTPKAVRRQDGVPLSLVVALDTSASQEKVLGGTKLAADVFVRGLMRPGVDTEVGVATFAGEAILEQYLTRDVAKARAAIARIKFEPPPGYVGGGVVVGGPPYGDPASTAVWDAVSVISKDVLAREPREVRRALVLISDGVDTSSTVKFDEAVREALRAEAVVYAVGVGDDKNFDGVNKESLRRLAERTGGQAFFPKKIEELPAIFTQIESALLWPYVVTFDAPPAKRDGSLRKIKIELVNPELRRRGVKLAHPQGYFDR